MISIYFWVQFHLSQDTSRTHWQIGEPVSQVILWLSPWSWFYHVIPIEIIPSYTNGKVLSGSSCTSSGVNPNHLISSYSLMIMVNPHVCCLNPHRVKRKTYAWWLTIILCYKWWLNAHCLYPINQLISWYPHDTPDNIPSISPKISHEIPMISSQCFMKHPLLVKSHITDDISYCIPFNPHVS